MNIELRFKDGPPISQNGSFVGAEKDELVSNTAISDVDPIEDWKLRYQILSKTRVDSHEFSFGKSHKDVTARKRCRLVSFKGECSVMLSIPEIEIKACIFFVLAMAECRPIKLRFLLPLFIRVFLLVLAMILIKY